jgi:polysaccharide biosynthesis protein PelG
MVLGIWGGRMGGLGGQLLGFAAGHSLTAILLTSEIDRNFGLALRAQVSFWGYFKKHWPLVIAGFSYNLAIWIDKFFFWWQPNTQKHLTGWLYSSPQYDNAMFIAYLTIVPALGLFLMKVETDFFERYKAYFDAIQQKASLEILLSLKAQMSEVIRSSFSLLVKLQATFSIVVVIFAQEIIQTLQIGWGSLFVFRAGVLGALLHVLALIMMIILMYFDLAKQAAYLSLFFLLTNASFTIISFYLGAQAYGFGYTIASLFTLVYGYILLEKGFEELEYRVFMLQPL